MAFSWKIERLDCKRVTSLESNYIVTAHWSYGDPDVIPDRIHGGVNFKVAEDNANYVPFEQVTEEMVWDWVWACGEVDKAKIEQQWVDFANTILNPVMVTPKLPWLA